MHVNATLKDKYLAGLWRQNLETQLLWRSLSPATAHRVIEYIAPSWSWASLEGEIDTTESKVQFLGCEVIPVSPDAPYGAVSSVYLRIRGQTVNGLFQLAYDGGWKIYKPASDITFYFHPGTNELFRDAGWFESNKMASLTFLLFDEPRDGLYMFQSGLELLEDRNMVTHRRNWGFPSLS
jgi:hypothetical protein